MSNCNKFNLYPCYAAICRYFEFNAFFIDKEFLMRSGGPFGSTGDNIQRFSSNFLKKMVRLYKTL